MKQWLIIVPYGLFVILVVAGMMSYDVWVDEAETGMYGRSIVERGVPFGWDGVNLFGHHGSKLLNGELINVGTPWLQFYLAALSFKIFGESAWSLRLPFAAIGMLVPWLTYRLSMELGGKETVAVLSMWLVSLSVPLILFMYQARYYSLSVALGLWFLIGLVKLMRGQQVWPMVAVIAIGYIYTNWLSFVLVYIAGLIAGSVSGPAKKWRRQYLLIGIAAVLAFVPWLVYARTGNQQFYIAQWADVLGHWWYWFWQRIGAYRQFGVLPVGLIAIAIWQRRRWSRKDWAGTAFLLSFVFMSLVVASFLGAMVYSEFINPANQRYLLVLMPVLFIVTAMVVERIWRFRILAVLVMGVMLFTNGLGLVWPTRFLLMDYVSEIMRGPVKPYRAIAEVLDKEGKEGQTVFVSLERGHEPLMFYLSKKFKFVNRAQLADTNIFPRNREVLPRYTYFFTDSPDWVVMLSKRGHDGSFATADYRSLFPRGLFPGVNLERDYEEMVLPISFKDTFRPELEWHVFSPAEPDYKDQIFIYHKTI